jgi:hypothetical protein
VAATDLADATGAVAPSAAAGHVVFSRQVPATGRFELVAWSAAGGLRVLPVGDRAVPFDADVGRDAAGRAVVSYSRCAVDGTLASALPSVDFSATGGCRPYVLDVDRPGARPGPLRLGRQARHPRTLASARDSGVSPAAELAPTWDDLRSSACGAGRLSHSQANAVVQGGAGRALAAHPERVC